MSKRPKARVATNGYRLCDPLPKGQILVDNNKTEWILGSPIGEGGFGDIYSCRRKGDRSDDFVMKLDHKDGPLFTEVNFYMRVAKEEEIKRFMTKRKLKFLGMPRFIATGIYIKSSANQKTSQGHSQHKSNRNAPTIHYRFLVMQRFGDLLEDYVLEKRLNNADAADIASKMIDVLDYIHSLGYIHADIKASNILKTRSKGNDWYLVDFGNADKYLKPNGSHREEIPDRKKANNGTVEYRSRDAHIGLLSRRSDIECLAYNLIHWMYGKLPWMTCLSDAAKVEDLKKKFMSAIDKSLPKCFSKTVPTGLKEFLTEVNKLKYSAEPNYHKLKELLSKVAKSKTALRQEEDEGVLEEEDSNGSVQDVRMNSPLKRSNQLVDYEDSDYEESDSDMIVDAKSPPKRSRIATTRRPQPTRRSSRETKRSPNKSKSPIKSKSPARPRRQAAVDAREALNVTIIISDSDDNDTQSMESDVEVSRSDAPVETEAMREMREKIERKKLEMQNKKKGSRARTRN